MNLNWQKRNENFIKRTNLQRIIVIIIEKRENVRPRMHFGIWVESHTSIKSKCGFYSQSLASLCCTFPAGNGANFCTIIRDADCHTYFHHIDQKSVHPRQHYALLNPMLIQRKNMIWNWKMIRCVCVVTYVCLSIEKLSECVFGGGDLI